MATEQHSKKTGPRDVFLHLLMIVTLYVSVVSMITLCFQYTNILFPDQLAYSYRSTLDTIRVASSSLVVVFPVFLLLSWMIFRDFRRNPEKREARLRKWLIYFTLFASAITIIVDLIRLVHSFYGGELTTPFLLKVASVLIIAGAVFGYYLWDLRRESSASKKNILFTWLTSVAILGGLIAGVFIVGTPSHQRAMRFDEQRASDLQMIQSEIINQWASKGSLPAKLDDLQNTISGFTPPKDPQTMVAYEYKIANPLSFSLCADFTTKSIEPVLGKNGAVRPLSPYDSYNQNWNHNAEHTCFARTIDPDLYKQPKQTPID